MTEKAEPFGIADIIQVRREQEEVQMRSLRHLRSQLQA
jgi:hypothetical protein